MSSYSLRVVNGNEARCARDRLSPPCTGLAARIYLPLQGRQAGLMRNEESVVSAVDRVVGRSPIGGTDVVPVRCAMIIDGNRQRRDHRTIVLPSPSRSVSGCGRTAGRRANTSVLRPASIIGPDRCRASLLASLRLPLFPYADGPPQHACPSWVELIEDLGADALKVCYVPLIEGVKDHGPHLIDMVLRERCHGVEAKIGQDG
jgi:hypothetical protein